MKLAVLCEDALGPVVRHRYRAVTPDLRAAGFSTIEFADVPPSIRARIALFRTAEDADLVLLSRKLFTRFDWMLLRRAAPRIAFDFDDAICFRDSSRGATKSPVRMRRFRRVVRGADVVTAGNPYLAGLATAQRERGGVVVAPTPIDAVRFAPAASSASSFATRGAAFRVGWIGSRSTRRYLGVVAAPLADLVRRVPRTTIAVMADQAPSELAGLPVEFTPWSEDAEVPFLRSLDAGLMPLPDDPWTRGKCGFKLLQYMACGVPALASDVGANREILADGAAGILCADDAAWTSGLARLADDATAARALGLRGRAEVEAKWAASVLGPRFAAALAAAAKGPAHGASS